MLLENLNAEFNKLNEVRNSLPTYVSHPNTINVPGLEQPKSKCIYKANGSKLLGEVGNGYDILQPTKIFDAYVSALTEIGLNLDEIDFKEHCEGSKFSFSVPIKKHTMKSNSGKFSDDSIFYLKYIGSVDRTIANTIGLASYREVCANMLLFSDKKARVKFKHTANGNINTIAWLKHIARLVQELDNVEQFYSVAQAKELDSATKDELLKSVLGYSFKEYKELSTRKKNILDKVQTSIELEFSRTGTTAYGFLNGITHYTNHIAPSQKQNNTDYIMFATGEKTNAKAEKAVRELVTI